MQTLTVIENELVPVYETSTGEKVVYGTELHEVLEVKTPYRTWIERRFSECEAIENDDYDSVQICTVSGGTPKKEHIIKLDIAKEMAMLERNEKGKQVRRYFIQVEKKYKNDILQKMSPELQAIIMHDRKIQQVDEKIESVDKDLQNFKRDLPILGIEENKITSAVRRKGVEILGGKGSNAYKNNSIRGKIYSDIHRELKRQFQVSTYKAIKRNQYDTAVAIIEGYKPPLVLAEEIKYCNAQMNIGEDIAKSGVFF